MKGLVPRSRELLPAALSVRSLHKACLSFEGGYSFKMKVTFPEDGWEQERGLGRVTPKHRMCGRAKGATKMLLGMSRSCNILGLKALLLLRGRRQKMSTQNCPNTNLSQRKSQKVT